MSGLQESVWFAMLASVAVKSTVVLIAAFLSTSLLRRQSAARRHIIWITSAAALLALPFLSVWMPKVSAPSTRALLANFDVTAAISSSPISAVSAAAGDSEHAAARSRIVAGLPGWRSLALLLWAVGAAAGLSQTLIVFAGMRRVRRAARPSPDQPVANELARQLGIARPVQVLETSDRAMPMTFGLRRPAILLPASARLWTDDRRRVVLLHELAHVRRGDAASHLLARLALILNWWNPLAWFAWRELLKDSERASDDLVLSAGTVPTEYAAHLLDVARAMQRMPLGWAAVPMARRSQLETRLRAILDARVNRNAAGRGSALAAALTALLVVLPLAAVRAQESPAAKAENGNVDALIRDARGFNALDQAASGFIARRQYDAARKLLDSSLAFRQKASTVDYGVGLANLGDLESKRRHFADAEAFYSKAAQTLGDRPEASRALIDLGVAMLRNKNPELAMSYFQSAQRVNPSEAGPAWTWMAIVQEREKNTTEAEAMFRSALAVEKPASSDAATTMELYARLLTENGRQSDAQPLLDRAKAARIALAAESGPTRLSAGVYRIGGGVKPPSILTKSEPEYTEEARLAKYQGTAVLSVVIGADGIPRNIRILRGLGLGLDDNAVAAVSTWRFQPGTKSGAPVPVIATIEVNFRLL